MNKLWKVIATGLLFLGMTGTAVNLFAQNVLPADKNATKETRILYSNMQKLAQTNVIFGHQDDLAYGVGWAYEKGRSDIKSVTGSYPGLYGWELGHLELDSAKNLDGVPFKNIISYVKEVYSRGGINEFSWHFNDPVTGATAWSTPTATVKQIIPGGDHHDAFVKYLDKFAVFVNQLKGPKGEMIPVIFRPLHEHTGSWFWWGKKECTPEEYIALWRFTINYLRETKRLHNLIIAYSAADYATENDYMERYPGDGYVDIIGFDAYMAKDAAKFKQDLDNRYQILEKVAQEHHKLPALTEAGYQSIPDPQWWTNVLLPVISQFKTSYVLTWRNWKEEHYFAPYPGQTSEADFKKFYADPKMIFQNKLKPSIYTKNL
ncbi:glycoside hydrolase family 26 protein [Mucilaginibacter arboris]|uniref:Mannan endo-1,4-beta-mannosidase n=1 Tax=Mucilaginibacter arboris TaxID=2682090 RepID=A0A7K1SZJ9_9SPHI|nr:glycosyl hydrolase [Mucilaginibacter arboris]MVN22739.1 beta-mannosidase [Mucilaginibacter arboris]